MSEQQFPHTNLIRNAAADGKNSSFVDFNDIKPENETVSWIMGAVTGGIIGAIPGFIEGKNNTKLISGGMLMATTAIGACLGGVVSVLSTRTHNQWSDKVLQLQTNNNTQQR